MPGPTPASADVMHLQLAAEHQGHGQGGAQDLAPTLALVRWHGARPTMVPDGEAWLDADALEEGALESLLDDEGLQLAAPHVGPYR
mgnify:CR=1 FL=1